MNPLLIKENSIPDIYCPRGFVRDLSHPSCLFSHYSGRWVGDGWEECKRKCGDRRAKIETLDNEHYPVMDWTRVKEFLSQHQVAEQKGRDQEVKDRGAKPVAVSQGT